MKHKRLSLVFLIGLFFLLVSTKKVNAAASDTLKLNYNSYVYNNKGKRVGKTVLKYHHKVKPIKKVEKTNKEKRYFIFRNKIGSGVLDTESLYWLPYKKIKSNYYYQIGKNKYIKCANVETIGKSYVYTSEAKVQIKDYLVPDVSKYSNYKFKVNKNYIIDRSQILSDDPLTSYRVRKTNVWIYSADVKSKPRQLLLPFNISTTPYERFSISKNTEIYDPQGKPQQGFTVSASTMIYTAKKQLYIWNPNDNKAELYYQVVNEKIYVDKNNGDSDYVLIKEGYFKASDVKIEAGNGLTPSNTPEQAKAAYEVSLAK